jgi:citronellol/citronellal dehydrogenase
MTSWTTPLGIGHTLVTGGGSGLGRSISLALARSGVNVSVLGRRKHALESTVELASASRGRIVAVPADLRDLDAVERAFATAEAEFGTVDSVVHAAGETSYAEAISLSTEDFIDTVTITLFGGFYVLRRWATALRDEGKPGSAVVLTSGGAWRGVPGVAHSSAGKAGLESFVRAVAREWGPYGLRVNIIGPGVFPVESSEALWRDSELAKRMLEDIPLGRYGDQEEIVGPTLFFLSTAASYVTGQSINVCGGASMFPWPVRPSDIARGLNNVFETR